MHPTAGLAVTSTTPPAAAGTDVVLRVGWGPLQLTAPCRVVYTVDTPDRQGFAYGTLPGHAETGEARFLIEWDRKEGGVWYDILAFSRPRHFLARLGYPLVRKAQKQFGRDSAAAMRRAVGDSGS